MSKGRTNILKNPLNSVKNNKPGSDSSSVGRAIVYEPQDEWFGYYLKINHSTIAMFGTAI